jgi:hypothetical protein
MRAWVPWLAALVVWNLTFDYQLRRAGDAFVAEQLAGWARQQPPALIRDAFRPRVIRAAAISSAAAGLVAAAGVLYGRKRARGEQR